MLKTTYIFNGSMKSVTPLTTCGPAASAAAGTSSAKPIPVTCTAQGRLMYMPASGIRSKLRGACTELVREALKNRELPLLTLQDAQLLRLGGVKQGGTEAKIPYAELQELLASNPLLSLFGASTPWIDGKLMVGHLYCQQVIGDSFKPMLVDGVRSALIRREPAMIEFLTDDALQQYAAEGLAVKRSVEVKETAKALHDRYKSEKDAEKRRELKKDYDALVKATKGERRVPEGMPLAGYEAIPPGSPMEQKIRLLNGTNNELGCLLACVERFGMMPLLGAHLAHGCGEIAGSWAVSAAGVDVGEVHLVPWVGMKIVEPGTVLKDALAAFKDFLSAGDLKPWTPGFVKNLITSDQSDE